VVIILEIIIIIIIEVREIIIILIIEIRGIIDRVVIIEIGILRGEITEIEIREIIGREEIIDHHRLVLRILGNIILVLLDITPVIHIKWHHLDILKVVIIGNIIIGMGGIHHINLHRDLVVVVDLLLHPVIIIIIMIHH